MSEKRGRPPGMNAAAAAKKAAAADHKQRKLILGCLRLSPAVGQSASSSVSHTTPISQRAAAPSPTCSASVPTAA